MDLYRQLAENEQDATVWQSKAEQLLSQGDIQRCKLVLETLVDTNAKDVKCYSLLVEVCLKYGYEGYAEAVAVARRGNAVQKGDVTASLALAVALGHQARHPVLTVHKKQQCRLEAVRVLESVVGKPGHALPLIQYNLAVLKAELGQVDAAVADARAAYEGCSSSNPDLTQLCVFLLALLLSSKQQHDAALRILAAVGTAASTPASGSGPDPPASQPGPRRADVLVGRLRARLLQAQTDLGGAIAVLAQLQKRLAACRQGAAPLSGLALQGQQELEAQVWQDMAQALAARGDLTDALFCVEQLRKAWPTRASTYHVLGVVHEAAGQPEQALDAYNTALALEPRHAPSLLRLGTLYRRRGTTPDVSVSREFLTDALRYDTASAAGWFQLGLAAKGLGHREEAEKHLMTAVSLAAASPVLPFAVAPLVMTP
mmetsp:Transcript_36208/g.80562  ORF Transcript_36208/g.80562 Transcript_36208/m.80562 type:complete len:429 (-) Transcript_36208:348-1634(-)|eukprot:CAMPEP_0202891806 /NCGR_PEP_ID=MMETSP1392-20130828/1771_1 /ASSEMBLY_ACC=CAM_ASM_000868 /TAXON_ID=225041 /ORGANISM="Chlamydomonas chlamydogama, Strain SAG 11-48b" /LENGTH=428 /DNA_ID=CAMNT_0049575665 /DNA_START=82 /DNA_END=1368 /DNA_ORIENTATION=+